MTRDLSTLQHQDHQLDARRVGAGGQAAAAIVPNTLTCHARYRQLPRPHRPQHTPTPTRKSRAPTHAPVGLAHAARFRAVTAIALDASGTTAFVAGGLIQRTHI